MSHSITTSEAIDRYCQIRHRLPAATHAAQSVYVNDLSDLADEFDLFVLDGFGVLNVGANSVPGAAERIKILRAAGATVVVLTNGATSPVAKTVAKYVAWDMAFDETSVVSSRDALVHGLQQEGRDALEWGVAGTSFAAIDQLPGRCHLLEDDDEAYDRSEGFILLSALDWTNDRQQRLLTALRHRPRPVLVGNPDLVAPHPERLSLEPGWYAHQLIDELTKNAEQPFIEPVFYGKPFINAFDAVTRRFPEFEPRRIAMVGDSPHTDILGGAAAGWRTVLVQHHGLCKDHDLETVFEQSGIRPDFVTQTT